MALSTAAPRRSSAPRFAYVRELWDRRDFTKELAFGNMAGRYAGNVLGVAWWVLNPLLMTAVYFVVFGIILGGRKGDPVFLAYLLAGVFSFRYMQSTMVESAKMITNNAKLVSTIRFPRMILPIAALVESLVAFLVSLATFYLLVAPINQIYPTWWLLFLPVPILIHTGFSLGLGALTARLVVPVRDVKNLIPHLTRMWFYLSPILWTLDRIEDAALGIRILVMANPMYSFLSLYRIALLGPYFPGEGDVGVAREFEPMQLLFALAWTIPVLTIGVWSFVRNEGSMARHL